MLIGRSTNIRVPSQFDQKQKALGLPTSDDMATEAMIEKAKNMPGSPFLPPEMGGAPREPSPNPNLPKG